MTHGEAGIALLETLDLTRWLGKGLRVLRMSRLVGAIDWVISVMRPVLSRFVKETTPVRRPPT
jgi:spore maturation protein SpmB